MAQSCEVALDAADYFGRASLAQEKAGHFKCRRRCVPPARWVVIVV